MCPVCCGSNKNFAHVAIVEADENEGFNLYRCSECGLLFVYPVPLIQCHFHDELNWKPVQRESLVEAKRNYFRKVLEECATGLSAGSRVLDFGCGFGHFLAVVAEAGHYVEGVDISPGCRQYMADNLCNITVYS
jgi:SAM-dependent methyltransferase